MNKTTNLINKSAVRMLIALTAFTFSATQADAQGFLNKLKDKAKSAVDSKVSSALGGALGKKAKAAAESQAGNSSDGDLPNTEGYAAGLAEYIDVPSDFTVAEASSATANFATYSDALKAMPAIPTADELMDEGKRKAQMDKWSKFLANVSAMEAKQNELLMTTQNEVQTKSQSMAAAQGPSNASAQEMMEYVMKLSPAERAKLESLEEGDPAKSMEYIKKNHPKMYAMMMKQASSARPGAHVITDSDESRIKLYDEPRDNMEAYYNRSNAEIQAKLNMNIAVLQAGGSMQGPDELGNMLNELAAKVQENWLASEECKKVDELESELWKKQHEWEKNNAKDRGKFTVYAPFFPEERAKQNAVIDAFNKKTAEQWVSIINKYIADKKADVTSIADINAQANKLISTRNKKDAGESIAISNYLLFQSQVYGHYVSPYLTATIKAFAVPMIAHVETQPLEQ